MLGNRQIASHAHGLDEVAGRNTTMRTDDEENAEPVALHVEIADEDVEIADQDSLDQPTGTPHSYVFLHGLGGTHRYWTAANGARHLPPGSTLIDLFGFGRSPRPLTRYTLEKHLSALESALADRGPFVLVGHSLGAALAVAYAARHPAQIERLVLLSLPAYESQKSAVRWLRQRLRGWFFTNMVLNVVVCIGIRRILGPVLPYVIRDVPREVARDLVEHNFMSSTTSLWNVLYRHDIRAEANALPEELPVVFIHGTNDTTAPISQIQRLVQERDSWRLIELNGVDHHPWLRQPETCAELIAATAKQIA
ncbi:MAG: alpha/beta fold hydrolase [Acidimicrobiia bacterium]|nr:MAG: alpha/beta fold hydrolase [Acidimicrobiia bacterium]